MSGNIERLWWRVKYKPQGEDYYTHWNAEGGTRTEAIRDFHKEFPDIAMKDIEAWPFDPSLREWVRLGGRYPEDSVNVSSSDIGEGVLSVSRQGGGFVKTMSWGKFLEAYRPATQDEMERPQYHLSFFCFDEGPTMLAFTAGYRWNGWGCPAAPRELIERWIEAEKKELGESYFRFNGDTLEYMHHDDEEVYGTAEPTKINYMGREIEVYGISLGLCWNEYTVEDIVDTVDQYDSLSWVWDSVQPEGVDVSAVMDPIREAWDEEKSHV